MTDIPIYRRTELPPSRVGAVKPPMSLADQSGPIGLGQAIASTGNLIFEKVVKAQAANEVAEAKGTVRGLEESYKTFIADNPNASPEDLKKQWDKILRLSLLHLQR